MAELRVAGVQAAPVAAGPAVGARRLTLTFAVDSAALRAAERLPLLGEPTRPLWRRVETTYFDSEDGDLGRDRAWLGMRRLRVGYAMGLSWDAQAPAGGRAEIKLRSAAPLRSRLSAEDAERLDALAGEKPLVALFAAHLRRSRRFAHAGAATIEVEIDAGFLAAGAEREPVREIRMRLVSGEAADLYRFALATLEVLPMRIAARGALERGARLASRAPPACAGAAKTAISLHEPTEDAICAILVDCVSHFVANWPLAGASESSEAVHQMRVALRRLRAALAFFSREFPCREFAAFREEAKAIAATLGRARDWDVFIALVETGPAAHFGDEAGFSSLLAAARRKAAAEHENVQELATSQTATRFVLSMKEFLARRGWREALDETGLGALGAPIVDFAARTLDRLDRKTRRRGKHFDDLGPEARHKVRIALKNVRYAADFFGPLFHPRKAMRRYGRRAAALQDLLGVLNDADVAAKMLGELKVRNNPAQSYAAGLIAGWCERGVVGDDASREAWRSLLKVRRPWRASLADAAAEEPSGA
jgi:inorganic triphosphatase YgiF